MLAQPAFECVGVAVGQHIDAFPRLDVDQDRGIPAALGPREVVDPEHTRWYPRSGHRHAEQDPHRGVTGNVDGQRRKRPRACAPSQLPRDRADLAGQPSRAPLIAFEHPGKLLTERLPGAVHEHALQASHDHHDGHASGID